MKATMKTKKAKRGFPGSGEEIRPPGILRLPEPYYFRPQERCAARGCGGPRARRRRSSLP